MSSEDAFNEQYAAWHLYKGARWRLVEHVTVTRGDRSKHTDLEAQTQTSLAFFRIDAPVPAMGAGGNLWAFAL